MTITKLVAVPYDITAPAFYFNDIEEYQDKLDAHCSEEFEIQFIDGSGIALWLSDVINIAQCNIEKYFDLLDEVDTEEKVIALKYLISVGFDLDEAIATYQDVHVYHGDPEEYVAHYYEESGLLHGVPECVANYIDYEAIANDWLCGGDIIEIDGYTVERYRD